MRVKEHHGRQRGDARYFSDTIVFDDFWAVQLFSQSESQKSS